MGSMWPPRIPAASLLAVLLATIITGVEARAGIFGDRAPVAFLSRSLRPTAPSSTLHTLSLLRGGAEDNDDEVSDDSEDEEDEEIIELDDDEEEEEHLPVKETKTKKKPAAALDSKLAASTLKKETTSKAKASKQAVNAKLTATAPKKKKRRLGFRLPYILRACMNPVTVVKMTVAYWQSLFQLDYGKQDSSQELRSALQAKARTQGGGGGGKRSSIKPRRGRATTINDLPKLNT